MDIQSLEDLLERLNRGDPAAAERAFVEYEPYLRKVVRRLLPAALRSKFDSVDIVQSVYGDVLAAFRDGGMRFGSVARLRAFLVTATRNRFIDRLRQHERASRREVRLSDAPAAILPLSPRPRPSQAAVAAELWDRLLALCPPEHHQLLRLRRRGATAQEIAAETGMHEGSVRRILRDLAVRLACSEGPITGATAR